ncbi:MAG: hypothetical protein ACXVOI_11645 [Tumebacillaceae bacterium]
MKPIIWIARGCAYLFVVYSLYTLWMFYFSGQSASNFQFRGLSDQNAVWAMIVGSCALMIWVVRRIYIELKRREVPNYELTKHAILFFRKNHIVFGWVTLITVTAHGLYYLFVYSDKRWDVYTGWSSWGALCVLALLGVFFDKKLTSRQSIKRVKIYHIGLAFVFVVGVTLHMF